MEVWIDNDTLQDITPTRVTYSDPRFRGPVPGERLRLNPSRSERGYPLALPSRPACGRHGGAPRLTVTYAGRTVRLPVADDTDTWVGTSSRGASSSPSTGWRGSGSPTAGWPTTRARAAPAP